MPIVRHTNLNNAWLGVIVFWCVIGFALFRVPPEEVSLMWIRPIWRIALGVCFAVFSYGLLGIVRKRGRLLVGGQGWIAEYRAPHLRPLAKKALVTDVSELEIKSRPISGKYKTEQYKDWVEIYVADGNGTEVVRCFANPKWLIGDYEERFQDWKHRQAT